MNGKIANADEGWRWYVAGWELFKKNPGTMVGQLLILLVLAVASNLVPLVGGLVMALITPVLVAGWYYSIRQLDTGKDISPGDLFEGFRNKAWTGPLIILGGVMLGMEIILGVTTVALLGAGVATGISLAEVGALDLSIGIGGIVALLLTLLLAAIVFTAMFYAIPLVVFQQSAPIAALKASFWSSLHNWLPLLVFGLVYLVLAIIAVIPFGLGFLVLVPVSVCAAYCSYKTVFE